MATARAAPERSQQTTKTPLNNHHHPHVLSDTARQQTRWKALEAASRRLQDAVSRDGRRVPTLLGAFQR
eukprot:7769519-Alexandrium_andersonii.AAC.1